MADRVVKPSSPRSGATKTFMKSTSSSSASRERQRLFAFLAREHRLDRWFKRAIMCATLFAIVVPFVVLPKGRYLVAAVASRMRKAGRMALLQPAPRSEIDQDWQRIPTSRDRRFAAPFERDLRGRAAPAYQGLMRYAGLDSDHGLLRSGNYDQTLLLPSTVFEPDDAGRSYRMRPCVDSIWLREVAIQARRSRVLSGPRSSRALRRDSRDGGDSRMRNRDNRRIPGASAARSRISSAPVRGIVLGDSYMQGLFLGEDETPPECLKRDLEARLQSEDVDPEHRGPRVIRRNNTITRCWNLPIDSGPSSSS